jgi:bifunctional DNA-binding transcriptional regulator/antitoxin component of YhaV-PrlF toxin-antitoxin module
MGFNYTALRRLQRLRVTPPEVIVDTASVRRKLAIKEGTRIQVEVNEETRQIILTPITCEYIHSLRGKYKGKGLLRALMEEKKREREL